jgi:hypothetical protein
LLQADWSITPVDLSISIGEKNFGKCKFEKIDLLASYYTQEASEEQMLFSRPPGVVTMNNNRDPITGYKEYMGMSFMKAYATTVIDPETKNPVSLCILSTKHWMRYSRIGHGGMESIELSIFVGKIGSYRPFCNSEYHKHIKKDADREIKNIEEGWILNDRGMFFKGKFSGGIASVGVLRLPDKTEMGVEFKPLPEKNGRVGATPPEKISYIILPDRPHEKKEVVSYTPPETDARIDDPFWGWTERSLNPHKHSVTVTLKDAQEGDSPQNNSQCRLYLTLGGLFPSIRVEKEGELTAEERWEMDHNPSFPHSTAFHTLEKNEG